MKKIMFGNSLMLLGIAIMILAGLKVIYVGTLWVVFVNKKVLQKGVKKVSTFNTQ